MNGAYLCRRHQFLGLRPLGGLGDGVVVVDATFRIASFLPQGRRRRRVHSHAIHTVHGGMRWLQLRCSGRANGKNVVVRWVDGVDTRDGIFAWALKTSRQARANPITPSFNSALFGVNRDQVIFGATKTHRIVFISVRFTISLKT